MDIPQLKEKFYGCFPDDDTFTAVMLVADNKRNITATVEWNIQRGFILAAAAWIINKWRIPIDEFAQFYREIDKMKG